MKTQTVELEQSLKLWKKLMIDHCEMEFSCGGDSMGEFIFKFYDENEKVIQDIENLDIFFDREVYNNVVFYDSSDGEYLGEFGTVRIVLNDDGDDFEYTKLSSSEYCQEETENFNYELTDEEFNLLDTKVSNINGDNYGFNINYKLDCIITDNELKILDDLEKKILDFISGVKFSNDCGELQDDSERFECDVQSTIDDKYRTIELIISRSYYVTVTNDL